MNKITQGIFLIFVAINIFFCAWYVLHGDIIFSPDIARDFHLLVELDEKKFILIGPRSSVLGLFHGPLWLYMQYPAFLIGNGNPIAVGWFWIILTIGFLISYYFIAKKLFNELTAWMFVTMSSAYLVYHVNGLFNPHGALFLLPIFFFLFVRYIQTLRISYLIAHILVSGMMIQFQMAIGIPFFILSAAFILVFTVKKKRLRHLFILPLLFVTLGTFILFDFRHDFLLSHSALRHLQQSDPKATFGDLLTDRIRVMTQGMEFLRFGPANGSFYAFLVFAGFLFLQIKKNIHKPIYLIFLYFFLGFFALSLFNRYALLYFYVFPLFLLVFMIFASFVTSQYKTLFLCIFFVIYAINLAGLISFTKESKGFIGKSEYSWQFLDRLAKTVYVSKEDEFGYFVYSPDVLAYEAKYAMLYEATLSEKRSFSFQKKPITFLVTAPPPRNNPFMKDEWWRKNQVGIQSNPIDVKRFENGYKIEKYMLSLEEIAIPYDQSINPGIHFR